MDQWHDVKVTKGLQWLTWVCRAGVHWGVRKRRDLNPRHPWIRREPIAGSEGISSSLIRPCGVSCPSKLDCLLHANGFNPAIYCSPREQSRVVRLNELYWTMHSQRRIVFSSAIVQAVSHHWCPPHSILAGHLLNRDSCTICVITLGLVESIARKICLASSSMEGQ